MKKKNKKNQIRMRFSTILLCILTISLCAAPALHAADETVLLGQTKDIDYTVTGILWIYGTANLQTGASITQSIYVQNGGTMQNAGTLNMYSGTIGLFISVSPGAVMTVYGTDFAVSNGTIQPDGNWIPDPDVGMGTLTGYYGDTSPINLLILSSEPINLQPPPKPTLSGGPEEITIDIKPGSELNSINLKSKGVVPVAVLTKNGFDASTVDPESVTFAGASPVRSTLEDVDGDDDLDMLFHFRTQELNLDEDSTKAALTGQTKDGIGIAGTDEVRIVRGKK